MELATQEDGHGEHAKNGSDTLVQREVGGAKDDPGPLREPLLRRTRSDERPEDLDIGVIPRHVVDE